jgi:predicted transcriptional regulator
MKASIVGVNRDKIDIVAAVLKAAETGAGITHLFVSANLSYALTKKYLKIAIESGLLQPNGQLYEITEKGRRYLQAHGNIQTSNTQIQKLAKTVAYEKTKLRHLLSNKEQSMAPEEQSPEQDETLNLSNIPQTFKRIDYDQFLKELQSLGFKPKDAIEIISWINTIAETKISAFFGKKSVTIKACLTYIGRKLLKGQRILSQRDVARFYGLSPSTIQHSFKEYQEILEKAKPVV